MKAERGARRKARNAGNARKGNISLWKAARLAGVSLREMTEYAVSQGLRAITDKETEREELS